VFGVSLRIVSLERLDANAPLCFFVSGCVGAFGLILLFGPLFTCIVALGPLFACVVVLLFLLISEQVTMVNPPPVSGELTIPQVVLVDVAFLPNDEIADPLVEMKM
jgi:hypothetical protein